MSPRRSAGSLVSVLLVTVGRIRVSGGEDDDPQHQADEGCCETDEAEDDAGEPEALRCVRLLLLAEETEDDRRNRERQAEDRPDERDKDDESTDEREPSSSASSVRMT